MSRDSIKVILSVFSSLVMRRTFRWQVNHPINGAAIESININKKASRWEVSMRQESWKKHRFSWETVKGPRRMETNGKKKVKTCAEKFGFSFQRDSQLHDERWESRQRAIVRVRLGKNQQLIPVGNETCFDFTTHSWCNADDSRRKEKRTLQDYKEDTNVAHYWPSETFQEVFLSYQKLIIFVFRALSRPRRVSEKMNFSSNLPLLAFSPH